ncbi:OPT family oligopeptide transporter [Archangium gephyra]|uniref:OPT family oligopeptide transporter n=1 Tax=Archangium gephyra TaxID=48 RepID=A0AAC8TDA5_9BACT|nr:OPT family oligopeptide transporter [Archangium gephyra]AKJ00271.1 Oligopeptide transporter, OPT family [Archangium gephyra]REG33030.1 OPT family oligopeptide transporter [Archangium gephyra]
MSERQSGRAVAAPVLVPDESSSPSLHPVPSEVPASTPPELTARALVAGGLIGAVLAVTNVYTGLKTGFWESGCVLSSLLAFGGLSAMARRGPPVSPLETNLSQTAAVSVGAVPATAGLLGAVPALAMLGTQPPGWAVALWGVGLGTLGVLFAFALRRRLLEDEALPFPTGAATAELISTLHSTGSAYAERVRGLWVSGLASMGLTLSRDVWGLVPQASMLPGSLTVGGLSANSLMLGIGWNPMMLGIGVLVGPRAGLSILLGSALAWAGLAPWLVSAKVVTDTSFPTLSGWLLWPGVGLMVGAAATSLLSQVGALPSVMRDLRKLGQDGAGWESTAGRWVARAVLPAIVLTGVMAWFAFQLSPLYFLLALLLTFPLCAVCARATGQTDIAPMSPVGQLAQVGFGLGVPGHPGLNVAAGGVVSGAASHTSGSLWSLQAGRLLGASASRQLLVQLPGVLLGAAVAVPAYALLVSTHGLGSETLPMPTAQQFKAVAELASKGLGELPPSSTLATGLGFLAGVLLSVGARGRLARWLPSAAAMGIGFVVPAYYSVTLCLGALLAAGVARFRPSATQTVQSAGAGAIVGESLLSVLIAALVAAGLIHQG